MKIKSAEYVNEDKVYCSSDHLTYSCQYHVVFCPKYRRKILVGKYKERVIEVFKEVAAKRNFKIIEMEVMPDHVHLLIDCNPKFGICKCVCQLKDTSSRVLRSEFPELTTRLPSLWTRSSFISSVGATSLDVVKEYIENQERQVNVKK